MVTFSTVGLSRTDLETESSFFKRLAQEISEFEHKGWIVNDVLLNFKSELNPIETTTALIILDKESTNTASETYLSDVECEKIISHPQSPSQALAQNLTTVNTWLSNNPDIEVYGVKSELVIVGGGEQQCNTYVYYSSNDTGEEV